MSLEVLLYLIEILHQTTTRSRLVMTREGCILSKFYIKPQQRYNLQHRPDVVSYRNSTSNHNTNTREKNLRHVVSYRNSTSNHNFRRWLGIYSKLYLIEILHQTTTLILELQLLSLLYLIEILHQTTTSARALSICFCCILSKFYIKPQRRALRPKCTSRCILSKFYIKPQLLVASLLLTLRCILSKFYIKPQLFLKWNTSNDVVSYRNSTSNHNVGPHID